MDPESLAEIKAIVELVRDAYAKSGGNWLLLLPWAGVALVQLYKARLVQALIASRWPGLAWGSLKLGWQILIAFMLASLPALGTQLLTGSPILTAAVVAIGAGLAAVLSFKPARAVGTALLGSTVARLPPHAQDAVSIVVPVKAGLPAVEAPTPAAPQP